MRHLCSFGTVLIATVCSSISWSASGAGDDLKLRVAPAVVSPEAPASAQPGGNQVPGEQPLDFLIGWDSVNEEPRYQKCVSYSASLPTAVESVSQDGLLDVDHGNSIEDYFEKQTLAVSAAASMGLGAYKGSATFELVHSRTLNQFSEYLRVTVFAKNNKKLILDSSKVNWSDIGRKAKASIESFQRICGDSFVVGKVTGGLFSGVYVGESKSESEQTQMRLTLSAAATAFSGDGKLDVDTSKQLQQFNQSGRIKFHLLRLGQSEEYPTGTPVDILDYARKYSTKVTSSEKASTLYYIVARYDQFFADSPKGGVSTANLDAEARYYQATYQRISDLQYMLNNTDQFGEFSVERARKEVADLQSALDKRTTDVVACVTASKSKCTLNIPPMPKTVPGRLIARPFDPRSATEVRIGSSVGEDVWVVENRGQWCFDINRACAMISAVDKHNLWRFQSRLDPVKSLQVSYATPMIIPANSDAYFHVDPGYFAGGNRNDNEDAKTILFRPLYPDEYAYPPGADGFR